MNGELSQKRFAFGATAITLSVIAVKVIGILYKIPLLKILGAEGMGYFNAAYDIYALFFVISTAGLPIAVSILIAESLASGKGKNVDKIHRISFGIFLVVGILGSLSMGIGARGISSLLETPGAAFAIFAISPTILFVCISGAMRGLFQGCQNMKPTAVSQVIEALGKLLFGLLFAYLSQKTGRGVAYCAAYAALGITAGSFLSAIYLLFCRKQASFSCEGTLRLTETDGRWRIFKRLLFLAIPVTLTSSLSGLMRVIDMGMIFRRLQTLGYEVSSVAAMYGSYSTLAVPIYNLPSSLVAGIALSLVPTLTEAAEGRRRKQCSELVESSFHMCFFLSFPCSVGLALFSKPILSLLFAGESESIELVTPLLSVLAFSVVASCLLGITSSILQAYRKAFLPIFSMLAGAIVKVVSAYVLIGMPKVELYGAAVSTLLCNLVAVGMNLYFIDRVVGVEYNVAKLALRPMLASLVSVGMVYLVWRFFLAELSLAAGFGMVLLLCVIFYLLLGGKMGAYGKAEVLMLPGGENMWTFLCRFRFVKRREEKNEQRGYDQRASREANV